MDSRSRRAVKQYPGFKSKINKETLEYDWLPNRAKRRQAKSLRKLR